MANRNLILYRWFELCLGMSFYAPLAIIYYSQVAGSYALGASIFSLVMIVSALGEVPTGIWSDKIGRKGTIFTGALLILGGTLFYALSHNYSLLVVGAVLEGLSRSFFSGNNDAFLHESLQDIGQETEYQNYLGKAMSMEHLGIALGAIIGGVIAIYSVRLAVTLTLIPLLGGAMITAFLHEPRSKHITSSNVYSHLKEAIRLFITNKKIRLLSLTDAISFSTGEVSYQFRATYFSQLWPLWAINLLNTTLQLGASASYYYSGLMIKKWGAEKLLVIRSIVGKLSGLTAFGISSIFSPLITIVPSFLYGAGQVAKNTLMQREFSPHQRATMSSLNSLISNTTFAISSVLIGLFADLTSPKAALLGITIISLPVIWLYVILFNHKPTQQAL